MELEKRVAISNALVLILLSILIQTHLIPIISLIEERRLLRTNTKDIIEVSANLRSNAEKSIYGIWAYSNYDYENELKPYFQQEKKLLKNKVKVKRIIDPTTVNINDMKDHLLDLKDPIINKKYQLSLNHAINEYLLVDFNKIVIYAEAVTDTGAGSALGPISESAVVNGHKRDFERLFTEGYELKGELSLENFDHHVQKWIEKGKMHVVNNLQNSRDISCGYPEDPFQEQLSLVE